MKIGEFARICRTTKEILLHYERKDLLKPKYVADKGYRGYGAEQYFDFISLLKKAGCTFAEIKERRSSVKTGGYLAFLKQKIAFLHEEQVQLAHRISMLTRLVSMAEKSATSSFDALFLKSTNLKKLCCILLILKNDGC